jgi:UDP-3-O-[3-hydroxymyristoyl] N-acetylglucosamine deacetylase
LKVKNKSMDCFNQEIDQYTIEQLESSSGINFPNSQHTLLSEVNCVGVGLHTGNKLSLTLRPADANTGIIFRRTDIPGSGEIPARWDNVVDTRMCTTIGNNDGVTISTIEHVMAALSGCGVDNVYVDVSGSEVPIMDGSAQPFVFLIECAGLLQQNAQRRVIEILKSVRVGCGNKMAEISPSNAFSVTFEIDFDSKVVSKQEISVSLVNGTFKKEVARARTFGFLHDVKKLRAAGLALGGSLDNAVVVEGDRVLNEDGLRYHNEFVRHKVLDAIGDLYTAGGPFLGSYKGIRAGHALNNKLLRALFADTSAWCYSNLQKKTQTKFVEYETKNIDLISAAI